jgi:hypothetical protein
VAVVAAFMGNAGELGTVGQADGFVYGQRVKIRPKGNIRLVRPDPVNRVKPASPVNYFKGGILFQEIDQMLFGPCFPAGQFRVLVQFMAQLYRPIQSILVHTDFSSRLPEILPKP